ncbi:TPA: hypothetical protein ACOD97_000211 [Stenotrophomonas maltophilia]
MKTCTKCHRYLPLIAFPRAGKRGHEPACTPCQNDDRRLRAPLPPIVRNPLQVRINNVVQLWHGPVRREPMRSIA